ncbi:MAG: dTDP-4-dehydrorhamnose 3,5-epimerase family protein [Chloroflexota bacterium]|nr:dTDP-4-dehydrorhamnose 3,5-epimerase family protein [Chloroflexota bacterium]
MEFHDDERGSFGELWRASWLEQLAAGAEMRQANLSRSRAEVLRGLHMHLRQADLWIVVEGHPFVALVDVRPLLEGTGGSRPETIDAAPGDVFYLPERVAHGFYARDPIALVYLVSNEYDSTDELSFAWNDPEAGVSWPTRQPILSERDQANPSLRELVATMRQQIADR